MQIEEFQDPQRVNCEIGKRYTKIMPASEACLSMKLTDQVVEFELTNNKMVQLYKNCKPFSSHITTGEAGLYWDNELNCFYFYQEV